MKMTDVLDIAREAQVDPTYFSVGDAPHEALCLVEEGGHWRVFLSERGKRYEEQKFESEDAACVHFLKRLFQLLESQLGRGMSEPH